MERGNPSSWEYLANNNTVLYSLLHTLVGALAFVTAIIEATFHHEIGYDSAQAVATGLAILPTLTMQCNSSVKMGNNKQQCEPSNMILSLPNAARTMHTLSSRRFPFTIFIINRL
jgi:hypothetical protein